MINCPKCGHRFSAYKRQKKSRKVLRRDGHEYVYLEGWKDHLKARLEAFARAGGEAAVYWGSKLDEVEVTEIISAICQGCSEAHRVGWLEGHLHHNSKSKGGRRCECPECLLFVCPSWHRAFHNRVVKFTQQEEL